MSKITANNTHRYDDIADTLADAIKIALIDKIVTRGLETNYDTMAQDFALKSAQHNQRMIIERPRIGRY